jgi:hypothetical protein
VVGWVKGSFFKQRRFLDDEDLRRQLAEWLVEVNTTRPSRATGIIPAVRHADEQPRLRPLKITPTALALRIPIVVGATAYVTHDTHRYSMPPDAIGLAGTLYLHRDAVRIVAGASKRRMPGSASRTRWPRCRPTVRSKSPPSPASGGSGTSSDSTCSSSAPWSMSISPN